MSVLWYGANYKHIWRTPIARGQIAAMPDTEACRCHRTSYIPRPCTLLSLLFPPAADNLHTGYSPLLAIDCTGAPLTRSHHKGLIAAASITFAHQSSAANQKRTCPLSLPRSAAQEKCGAARDFAGSKPTAPNASNRLRADIAAIDRRECLPTCGFFQGRRALPERPDSAPLLTPRGVKLGRNWR